MPFCVEFSFVTISDTPVWHLHFVLAPSPLENHRPTTRISPQLGQPVLSWLNGDEGNGCTSARPLCGALAQQSARKLPLQIMPSAGLPFSLSDLKCSSCTGSCLPSFLSPLCFFPPPSRMSPSFPFPPFRILRLLPHPTCNCGAPPARAAQVRDHLHGGQQRALVQRVVPRGAATHEALRPRQAKVRADGGP